MAHAPSVGQSSCLKYAVMIDAGSAGSRLHVYQFQQCKRHDPVVLLDEALFVQTIPGLSAYGEEPEKAADSLEPLLRQSLRTIPRKLHKQTPIAVKATAGLRLLGESQGERILDSVYRRLKKKYPFRIVGGQAGVSIMDGRDEGRKHITPLCRHPALTKSIHLRRCLCVDYRELPSW